MLPTRSCPKRCSMRNRAAFISKYLGRGVYALLSIAFLMVLRTPCVAEEPIVEIRISRANANLIDLKWSVKPPIPTPKMWPRKSSLSTTLVNEATYSGLRAAFTADKASSEHEFASFSLTWNKAPGAIKTAKILTNSPWPVRVVCADPALAVAAGQRWGNSVVAPAGKATVIIRVKAPDPGK